MTSPFNWQMPSPKPVIKADKRVTGQTPAQRTAQALRSNPLYQQSKVLT